MLSVTYKPLTLSVVMLGAVILGFVTLSVVAPLFITVIFYARNKLECLSFQQSVIFCG
jgi:hypothetical protein